MKKAVPKPVADKNDLKWKAIAAAQSTCSEVVLLSSYCDYRNLEAVLYVLWPLVLITKCIIIILEIVVFIYSDTGFLPQTPHRHQPPLLLEQRNGLFVILHQNNVIHSTSLSN